LLNSAEKPYSFLSSISETNLCKASIPIVRPTSHQSFAFEDQIDTQQVKEQARAAAQMQGDQMQTRSRTR